MAQVDQFVTITEAKNKLLDLIRNIKLRHQVVAITRGGVPTAVLLSMDQFEGLMETIEILSDSKSLRSLKRSLKQAEAGKWVVEIKVHQESIPSAKAGQAVAFSTPAVPGRNARERGASSLSIPASFSARLDSGAPQVRSARDRTTLAPARAASRGRTS